MSSSFEVSWILVYPSDLHPVFGVCLSLEFFFCILHRVGISVSFLLNGVSVSCYVGLLEDLSEINQENQSCFLVPDKWLAPEIISCSGLSHDQLLGAGPFKIKIVREQLENRQMPWRSLGSLSDCFRLYTVCFSCQDPHNLHIKVGFPGCLGKQRDLRNMSKWLGPLRKEGLTSCNDGFLLLGLNKQDHGL